MIKIYTPENWRSLFGGCPELVIDDDHYIYRGDEYTKPLVQPVGRIDLESGYVYGEDYYEFSAQPIGQLKDNGSETKIYGDDYYKLNAKPVYVVKDGKAYSYDEYTKFWGTPEAIIDSPQEPQIDDETRDSTEVKEKAQQWLSISSATTIALIVLTIFSLASAYGWVTGAWFDTYTPSELLLIFVPVLITAIIAFLKMKGISVIWFMVIVSGLLSWIAAAVFDLVTEGLTFTWFFADLLLGWLITIPICLPPALVFSVIILLVHRITGMSSKH